MTPFSEDIKQKVGASELSFIEQDLPIHEGAFTGSIDADDGLKIEFVFSRA